MPDLAIQEIHSILSLAHIQPSVIPATHLYNEGWMLCIVLSAEHRGVRCLPFEFQPKSSWCSEALLASPFKPRRRGDPLGEGFSNADGVVGHFAMREDTKRGLKLTDDGSQFIVIEAKMYAPLTAGTTRIPWYEQAARSVACMAQLLCTAGRPLECFTSLGFFVVAPMERVETHRPALNQEALRDKIARRIADYADELVQRQTWKNEWFDPLVERMTLDCITWESIIERARGSNPAFGDSLDAFYGRCKEFNER